MTVEFSEIILLYIVVGFAAIILARYIVLKLCDAYRPKMAEKIRNWGFRLGLTSLIALLVGMALIPILLVPISSGHVGVLWKRFGGTVSGAPYKEGSVIVLPWNKLIIYNARFQLAKVVVNAVTSEGLKVELQIDLRYVINGAAAPLLHKLIGENYAKVMLIPEVQSAARLIISGYTGEEVYGVKRKEIQDKILDFSLKDLLLKTKHVEEEVGHSDVVSVLVYLEDILIRDVVVPEKVHAAIISKVNQNYLDQEYAIKLKVAEKEATRKVIEARGIAYFQKTVVGGISETYLKWRGIEATLELAKSNNAKVILIGGGKNGLPLILNTADSVSSTDLAHSAVNHTGQSEEKSMPLKK